MVMATSDDTIRKEEHKGDYIEMVEKSSNGKKAAIGSAFVGVASGYAANEFLRTGEDLDTEETNREQTIQAANDEVKTADLVEDSSDVQTVSNVPVQQTVIEEQSQLSEPSFLEKNDVKIEKIETVTDDDGALHHVASGTVNGHWAVFVDDGKGHVEVGAVDTNDNLNPEKEEMIDLTEEHITMGDMADHLEEAPAQEVNVTPVMNDAPEVKVIAVDNNYHVDGQTISVAAISINDTPVVLLDVDQNGTVDGLIADVNGDRELTDDDVFVVKERIAMPTIDDVSPEYTTLSQEDELPDYSNDADITTYEI